MASISITETVLRDGNQSFMATRMPLKSFESILSTMDKAGYGSIECWGGATFDSCLRYLNEDPWERLKIIRNRMPHSKLQMLLRGEICWDINHILMKSSVTLFVAVSKTELTSYVSLMLSMILKISKWQ